jgi:uncharacterized protein
MLWAISCIDNSDTASLRETHMQPHRSYLDEHKSILVLAGATLTDDGQKSTGSTFVINVSTRAEAEIFSANDPFTKVGVFAQIMITRMRKSQWNPKAAEGA